MASITIAAIFGAALLLSIPLGLIFKVSLKPGNYPHIDGMRAIAALLVVCSHYLMHAGMITGMPVNARLKESLGAVGVQIFFSITGFLFTRKAMSGPVDIGGLIAARVRRIVPLYVVTMTAAIAAVFYILSVAHMPIQIHKSEFVRAYLFGFTVQDAPSVSGLSIAGQAGQMWTLAWEWRFYIFVPFLSVLLARRSWLPAFVGITAAFALTGTLDAGRVPAWVAFAPGIVAAVLVGRVKVGARVQAVLTVVGVAAFIAAIARNEYGLSQTALCAMGFVALFFGHRAPLSVRPLRLLGEVSYSIYMLHLLVASLFITYIHSDAVYLLYQTTEQRLPLAIACLVGLFVLSFASFALIERPFMRESGRKAAPETTAIGHA